MNNHENYNTLLNNILTSASSLGKLNDESVTFLRQGLLSSVKDLRLATLKCLKQFILLNLSHLLLNSQIHILFVKILTMDQYKYALERESTLKCIRSLTSTLEGLSKCPKSCIKIVISIAEHNDDKLRNVCIETLCEWSVLHPQVAYEYGVIKCIFSLFKSENVPMELMDALTLTIIHLLDFSHTRVYVRPFVDVEGIASLFTDVYTSKSGGYEERLALTSRVLTHFMKSWSGLYTLSPYSSLALLSIVQSLQIPSLGFRKWLISFFYDVICLSNHANVDEKEGDSITHVMANRPHLHYLYHFKAMQVIVLLDSGLLNALMEINTDLEMQKEFLGLIQILFKFRVILPRHYSLQVQSLAKLFSDSSNFSNTVDRHVSCHVLHLVEGQIRQEERVEFSSRVNIKSLLQPYESVKMLYNDESSIKSLLLETQVLENPLGEWNWDSILILVTSLQAQSYKKFEEIVKNTKFFKKLITYYCPTSQMFSESKGSSLQVQVITRVLELLCSFPDGIKLLEEHKFIMELGNCLVQVISSSSNPSHHNYNYNHKNNSPLFFSKERVARTDCGEYFKMMNILCNHSAGLVLLQERRILNHLYSIALLMNRDDLCMFLMTKFSHQEHGYGRILLTRLSTSGTRSIRKCAIEYLGSLALSCTSSTTSTTSNRTNSASNTTQWAIKTLLNLLYDSDLEISKHVLFILENLTTFNVELTRVMILSRPIFASLKTLSSPLKTRFLSCSLGFEFTSRLNFIEQELSLWSGNLLFVTKMELFLEELIVSNSTKSLTKFIMNILKPWISPHLSKIPPHFYGELCKTVEGFNLFKKRGYFMELTRIVVDYRNAITFNQIMHLKAALWAIGCICQSEIGIWFLQNSRNLLCILQEIATTSGLLSLRGTCFYVFGLIASTDYGSLLLDEIGWETVNGFSRFCFPRDLSGFFTIPNLHSASHTTATATNTFQTNTSTEKEIEKEIEKESKFKEILKKSNPKYESILTNIGNLTNHILSNASSKKLLKTRAQDPELFRNTTLYYLVGNMLSRYSFRLAARRFLEDVLFDQMDWNSPQTWKEFDLVSQHG